MHMKNLSACLCLLACIAGFAVASQAADIAKAVHFAQGKTSATLKGSIRGEQGIAYQLGASQGQAMSILFKPSNASCYFNVMPPGGDTAIFIGSTSGNEFTANLDRSGTYQVQVYLMRNAARRNETCSYSITFEIGGDASAGENESAKPAALTRGNMPAYCRGEASGQYGVKPAYIKTDAIASGADGGSTIDGTADQGTNGIKKFRCRFDSAGRFVDVMALTSDGE